MFLPGDTKSVDAPGVPPLAFLKGTTLFIKATVAHTALFTSQGFSANQENGQKYRPCSKFPKPVENKQNKAELAECMTMLMLSNAIARQRY